MTPAMYIFINKGLRMSPGKMAAQAAHAAVEAYRISLTDSPERGRPIQAHVPSKVMYETNEVRRWYCGGHYMKLVMECRDAAHLRDTAQYLRNRGFNSALILDEGLTEIEPITPTALGVEIVDKDLAHVRASFASFDLYSDPSVPPAPPHQRVMPCSGPDYIGRSTVRPRFGLSSLGWLGRTPSRNG